MYNAMAAGFLGFAAVMVIVFVLMGLLNWRDNRLK